MTLDCVTSRAPVEAISVVLPVRNGEQWLEEVLDAILADSNGRDAEIIVVEDGSRDRSAAILERYANAGRIVVIEGPRRGAAAALNVGIERATHPIVCQIDQDVIIQRGWIASLIGALKDPSIAAAQGYYIAPPDASRWARAMNLDLQLRYRRLLGRAVNHVCTGNTAYRSSALRKVGLFDETLGYGYDNDISYRLSEAGYRLVICPEARSTHRWRDGWRSYLVQQYGFGYGRLDLVAKHHRHFTGDDLSRLSMMLHPPLFGASLALLLIALLLAAAGLSTPLPAVVGAGTLAGLGLERLIAGLRAAWMFRDIAGVWFVPVHTMRDLAWTAALIVWSVRRVRGIAAHPAQSMHPRPVIQHGTGQRH